MKPPEKRRVGVAEARPLPIDTIESGQELTMNRRSSIHIRSLPSVGATERAIGKAYSREDIVTLRSLKYA